MIHYIFFQASWNCDNHLVIDGHTTYDKFMIIFGMVLLLLCFEFIYRRDIKRGEVGIYDLIDDGQHHKEFGKDEPPPLLLRDVLAPEKEGKKDQLFRLSVLKRTLTDSGIPEDQLTKEEMIKFREAFETLKERQPDDIMTQTITLKAYMNIIER